MSSSKSTNKAVKPPYPNRLVETRISQLTRLTTDKDEQRSILLIVQFTIPPANIRELARVATILYVSQLIDRDTYRCFYRFASRNLANQELKEKTTWKRHPYFQAITYLYKLGRKKGSDGRRAVNLLARIGSTCPPPEHFSATMYYKHIIGLRDICQDYWNTSEDDSDQDVAKPETDTETDLATRLEQFTSHCLRSGGHSLNTANKLAWTSSLAAGNLMPGCANPRTKVYGRKTQDIGSRITITYATLESISIKATKGSAVFAVQCTDDEHIAAPIVFPKSATTKDRQRITGHVLNGYARTNVRTTADMTCCSIVTHRRYLIQASSNLDKASFALVWLAAFTGIDYRRPFMFAMSPEHIPIDDEIVVDRTNQVLVYKILRRQQSDDPLKYESCGVFRLPITQSVSSGLSEMIEIGSHEASIVTANRFAAKISSKCTGLTSTLNRLRSAARIHFAPLGFTELEFSAIAGRVPPSLKAVSAYYPHSSARVAKLFSTTYESAARSWQLPTEFQTELPESKRQRRDTILCKRSDGVSAARNLLGAIGAQYKKACNDLQRRVGKSGGDSYRRALNLSELACYALQELGVGLRPTGKVAEFSAASPALGCMTADKGSRIFSERSYSPVSDRHLQLLRTRALNRLEYTKHLRFNGVRYESKERNSSLAIRYKCRDNGLIVEGVRLTGAQFRESLSKVSGIFDVDRVTNWLRHVAAEYIGGSIPQWQSDEFLSHRRVGREAFGRWSTAGPAHFNDLRKHLDELHAQIIPANLLLAITEPSKSGASNK